MTVEGSAQVFATVIEILSHSWPHAGYSTRHGVERWKVCEIVAPHIGRVKERYLHAGASKQTRWGRNLDLCSLLSELGWYCQERGFDEEAQENFRLASETLNCLLPEPGDEATEQRRTFLLQEVDRNIGTAAIAHNDAQTAIRYFSAWHEKLVAGDGLLGNELEERTDIGCCDLGLSLLMGKQYEEAISWLLRALEHAARIHQNNRKKLSLRRTLPLVNLALGHWLLGRIIEARKQLYLALEEREQALGRDDRDSMITGRILFGIGNVNETDGNLRSSLQFHERALLHFKETVGYFHHRTGNSCFKVAEHYRRLGRHAEAHSLLDQALQIFSKYSWHAAEKSRVALLKSDILRDEGKSEDAEWYRSEAEKCYELIRNVDSKAVKELSYDTLNEYVHVWAR